MPGHMKRLLITELRYNPPSANVLPDAELNNVYSEETKLVVECSERVLEGPQRKRYP